MQRQPEQSQNRVVYLVLVDLHEQRVSHHSAKGTAVFAGALPLILALTYDVATSHTERKLRAEQNSSGYAFSAEKRMKEACGGLSGEDLIACVQKEVEATNEHKRSEYDLTAQQDMDDWSFWLLWVSVSSVTVSTLAVILVWRTLDVTRETLIATQDMARDTREIGEAQVRSYLHCTSAKFSCSENVLHVDFMIKNTGQSPATRVAVDAIAWVSVMRDEDMTHMHVAKSTTEQERLPTIMSSGETRGMITFYSSKSEIVENKPWPDIRAESAREIFGTANVAEVAMTITWLDVFGIESVANCYLATSGLHTGAGRFTVLMDSTIRKTGAT